jgi:hypothetical protein
VCVSEGCGRSLKSNHPREMTVYDEDYFEKALSGVESVDLKGLLMGDAGASALANVLRRNRTVSWLDLQYNRIGPEVS